MAKLKILQAKLEAAKCNVESIKEFSEVPNETAHTIVIGALELFEDLPVDKDKIGLLDQNAADVLYMLREMSGEGKETLLSIQEAEVGQESYMEFGEKLLSALDSLVKLAIVTLEYATGPNWADVAHTSALPSPST